MLKNQNRPMYLMGSTQHKSSLPVPIYRFKPYKLVFDSYDSKCRCQNLNISRSPKPRSGHRIVCDDTNMYSFGGYNPSLSSSDEADMHNDSAWGECKPLFKELWKYNISTASWKKLNVEDIPNFLASNAVVLSGQVLMVFGGTGVPFGANCSNSLYISDLHKGQNNFKFNCISATGNCPQPQYGQAIVLIGHFLYTIGGTTGFEYTCDIHRLNLRERVWEAVYTGKGTDNEPSGRYRHEVAFHGDKILVLGGGTSNETFDFQIVFAFNITTCKWEKIHTRPDNKTREAYPVPRRCHSSVQHNQYAYIIGGYSQPFILKDIWRLDLNNYEWKKFPKFSLDRGAYFHSSCVTGNGKLVTFGGIVETETTSTRSAAVHSAWLGIPKLKDICWEAVMFYHPNLDSMSEQELVQLGLPYEFIRKLDLQK